MSEEYFYRADFEREFNEMHENSKAQSREKGIADGRRNLPLVDTDFMVPFEKSLVHQYQSFIESIGAKGGQFLQELYDQKVAPIRSELAMLEQDSSYLKNKLQEERMELDRKLDQASNNHQDNLKVIENEPSWMAAKEKFENAKRRFKEVTSRINREELHISLPKWIYLTIIFAIGVSELPINYQVFVSFRETPLLTFIMACILVISLPVLAHFSGKFLRQYKENKSYLPLLFITFIAITALSYFTALLRKNYLGQRAGVSLDELQNDFWTFFIISMIIYLVGSLASFFAHDPSIEFTHVNKIFEKEKESFELISASKYRVEKEERNRYEAEINRYQNEFTEHRRKWENLKEDLKNELATAVSNHDKALAYFIGLEQRVSSSCKESINAYRDTNLTHRNNHKQPKYWSDKIPDLVYRMNNYVELSPNPKTDS